MSVDGAIKRNPNLTTQHRQRGNDAVRAQDDLPLLSRPSRSFCERVKFASSASGAHFMPHGMPEAAALGTPPSDGVGGFLRDHDRGGIRVSADERRHHARIHDS